MLNKISKKLKEFTLMDLENLIEETRYWPHMYKKGSIKKIYQNWLRNDKIKEPFRDVFLKKYESYKKKKEREEAAFEPYQVGFIKINWVKGEYEINLIGERPYRVYYADFVIDKTAKIKESLRKFCKTNKVRLIPSKTDNCLIIETVYQLDIRY